MNAPQVDSPITIKKTKLELLNDAFERWSGKKPISINKLPASGSKREYFRITSENKSVIGAINADLAENKAFLYFTQHFSQKGLPVPEIYFTDLENHLYLMEDLGDITLFQHLANHRKENEFSESFIDLYKQVIKQLIQFQILGSQNADYTQCFPRSEFDGQSMQWDLSYFKYYFLKLADIPFNEQLLEDDFNCFIDFLLTAENNFFLYRDFQSRNVMIANNQLYFIDYQGGRKGALHYDLASLLYDAKADIPQDVRELLLDFYIVEVNKYLSIDANEFKNQFYAFVLIRIMQAMGAYGFRGFYEKKTHFLLSIPYAIQNLDWIIKNKPLTLNLPTLQEVFHQIITSEKLKKFKPLETHNSPLTIAITSFSYKKGLPIDTTENGGGFIFDCRALHNPGRYEEFKTLTGKDQPVIEFFSKEDDVHDFLSHAYAMVDLSVESYQKRNFSNLMVSFGCTGGQHRSVYCAERLAEHLKQKYTVQITLWHREQD